MALTLDVNARDDIQRQGHAIPKPTSRNGFGFASVAILDDRFQNCCWSRCVHRVSAGPGKEPVSAIGTGQGPALFAGIASATRRSLTELFVHMPPFADGQHLIRVNDPFRDLYAVQSGSFKAYVDDDDGREHVLGFFLPGDIIGLDAIHTDRYRANFAALEPSVIVAIPYAAAGRLFEEFPDLLTLVLGVMSRNIARNEVLSGDCTAEELMAAFLGMMSRRYAAAGGQPDGFRLSMSRRDIANHLRLAPETVSRIMTRFAHDGLIRVSGRDVVVLMPEQLLQLAGSLREM